jgi:hypothetical protein
MDVPLGFEPNDYNVRVATKGWVYYVGAVKRGVPLAGTGTGPSTSEGVLVLLLSALVVDKPLKSTSIIATKRLPAWQARRPWKIRVVRIAADRWGNTARGKVVHKERHPAGPVPRARLAELAEEARGGRFAPLPQ